MRILSRINEFIKNIIDSKVIIVISTFIFGFCLAIYLSDVEILKDCINKDVLTDIITFEVTIFAFLIPLSIDIITKLSERYQSEIVVDVFENNFFVRNNSFILLINIGFAIFIRMINFSNSNLIDFFTILIFIIFIILSFMIINVIWRIKLFSTNPDAIIDEIFKEFEEILEID